MDIKSLPNNVKVKLRSGMKVTSLSRCVEELVYNSLDAKSTAIAIRIDLNKHQLQIVDNGNGITKSNLIFLGIRYMTSKCQNLHELEKYLKSYGFRGETLANLSEISENVRVATRSHVSEETYNLNMKTREINEEKRRASKGTTITIGGFLYNLPVRQKKINEHELSVIKRQLASLSLIHYDVTITLRNSANNEVLYVSERKQSVADALLSHDGAQLTTSDLVEIKYVRKGKLKIFGLVAKKFVANAHEYIFVNKRPVSSSKLQSILRELLGSATTYLVYIQCPYSDVSIVYNSKQTTVEFNDWSHVENCLRKALTRRGLIEVETVVESEPNRHDSRSIGISQISGVMRSNLIKKRVNEVEIRAQEIEQNAERNRNKKVGQSSRSAIPKNEEALKFLERATKQRVNACKLLPANPVNGIRKKRDVALKRVASKSKPIALLERDNHKRRRQILGLKRSEPIIQPPPAAAPSIKRNEIKSFFENYDTAQRDLSQSNASCSNQIIPTYNFPLGITPSTNSFPIQAETGKRTLMDIFLKSTLIYGNHYNNSKADLHEKKRKRFKHNRTMTMSVKLERQTRDDNCQYINVEKSTLFTDYQEEVSWSSSDEDSNRLIKKKIKATAEKSVQTDLKCQCAMKKTSNFQLPARNDVQDVPKVRPVKAKTVPKFGFHVNELTNFPLVYPAARNKRMNYPKSNATFVSHNYPGPIRTNHENPNTEMQWLTFHEPENDPLNHHAGVLGRGKIYEIRSDNGQNFSDPPDITRILTENPAFFENCASHELPTPFNFQGHEISQHCERFEKNQETSRPNRTNFNDAPKIHENLLLNDLIPAMAFLPETGKKCDSKRRKIFPSGLWKERVDNWSGFPKQSKSSLLAIAQREAESLETSQEVDFDLGSFPDRNDFLESFDVLYQKCQDEVHKAPLTKILAEESNDNIIEETDLESNNRSRIQTSSRKFAKNLDISLMDLSQIFGSAKTILSKFKTGTNIKNVAVRSPYFKLDASKGLPAILGKAAPFTFRKRMDFIPKGQSPILDEIKKVDVSLSPNSKSLLLEALIQNDDELGTIKWTKYCGQNENLGAFFDLYYTEKCKQFENIIPDVPRQFDTAIKIEKATLENAHIVGQWDQKFIVITAKNCLFLLDQHAVDERIRLEALFKAARENDSFKTTALRQKIELTFGTEDARLLETFQAIFYRSGLKYSTVSRKIVFSHVPTCLYRKYESKQDSVLLERLVLALIDEHLKMLKTVRGVPTNVPNVIQNVLNMEACRGAIKFGVDLTKNDCKILLEKLSKCQLPFQCAHGRPTIIPLLQLESLKQNKKVARCV